MAAGVAPAVVRASSIMRINPPKLIVPRGEIGMVDRFTVYESQMTKVPELALSIDDFTARVMEPINRALCKAYHRAQFDNMLLAINPPMVLDQGQFRPKVELVPWRVWAHPDLVKALT